MDTAPFELLLDRYQSGEATTDELVELDRLLRADSAKRRVLVERTLLEVQLRRFFGSIAPTRTPARRRLSRPWLLVVAATVLLALALCLFALLHGRGEAGAAVESGVVRVNNVAVASIPTRLAFDVGGQVPAVLRLPDGAHAELDLGTRATLHGASGSRRIELAQGGGKFVVAATQAPLRIETPGGAVSASAAQFTVRWTQAGGLAVAVRAGAVEVESDGRRQTLAEGAERTFK